jgi:hypothetical protein
MPSHATNDTYSQDGKRYLSHSDEDDLPHIKPLIGLLHLPADSAGKFEETGHDVAQLKNGDTEFNTRETVYLDFFRD